MNDLEQRRLAMRREADAIAARRADVIAQHPSAQAKLIEAGRLRARSWGRAAAGARGAGNEGRGGVGAGTGADVAVIAKLPAAATRA